MVDLAALRSAAPGLLEKAAGDWQAIGDRLGTQITAFRTDVLQPLFIDGAWAGQAAGAANTNLQALSQELTVTREYTATMASLLRDAATGIRDAQALLTAAGNLAAASRLVIGPDGSVTETAMPPLVGGASPAGPVWAQAPSPAASEVSDLIGRALTLANEVDARIAAGLQRVGAFASGTAGTQQQAAARLAGLFDQTALPPAGTSPAEVNAWWKAMGASQQQRFIHGFPAQLGWMNGLPATARNQANRIVLAQDKAGLQARLAALQANEPPPYSGTARFPVENPAWQQWQDQVAAVQAKLAGVNAVETGLSNAAAVAGSQNVFLLGFDTSGNGHASVAVGNPDTATNTVTYVPGLGSKTAGATGDIGRATTLWRQATFYAPPGTTVSSVYWLGYNAPQLGLNLGWHNLDVTSTADAVAGGQSLTQFQAGLQAAHQPGMPSHTVVLGHSYGSLVVGEAAAHDSLHPGDLIVVGSPGMGVNNVGQLGMPSAHVWAGANSHDPVPMLPPSDPLATLSDPNAAHFGTNPATAAFGGRVFNANYDPTKQFWPIDPSAHSAYWDRGSSSLSSMAHIVDGQYGQVELAYPPAPAGSGTAPAPALGPGEI